MVQRKETKTDKLMKDGMLLLYGIKIHEHHPDYHVLLDHVKAMCTLLSKMVIQEVNGEKEVSEK